jgi:hypothetical protein
MVYKVAALELLPLRERPLHDHDEDVYIALVKNTLDKAPLYFSYSYDLTNSLQRQAQKDITQPFWTQADDRFFWNRFIQSDLIDFRNGSGYAGRKSGAPRDGVDPFILPVIFGTLLIKQSSVKGNQFTFALISRRSRFRGGTRHFTRGIDDEGHVANYNETEQIVIFNDPTGSLGGYAGGAGAQNGKMGGPTGKEIQAFSYVQTRGSIPVYWAEINNLHYTPKLGIRPIESALPAAKKHFDEQIKIYGENYLVNLVNQKGREQRMKSAYEQVVHSLISSPSDIKKSDAISDEKIREIAPTTQEQQHDMLHYVYFDFHNETKGLRWDRTQILLNQIEEGLKRQRYFCGLDMPGDSGRMEIRSEQSGVVRTNCMDCLDRTNVVQSMLAKDALDRILSDVGILKTGESSGDDPVFQDMFRNAWADNADVVSKAYSGTGALKTGFTRTGKRTNSGRMMDFNNSATRYFKQNFADGARQDGFDLVLGAYIPADAASGVSYLFVDRRPLLIQAIPYVLAMSVFLLIISIFTPRLPDSAVLPIRLFVMVWFFIGCWCLQFIYKHGMLYVSLFYGYSNIQLTCC